MSGEDKNKLDELFRKGLDSPDREPGFAEGDWNDLKALLDGDKKHRGGFIMPIWPYLSGVAALLLLALGWWFFTTGKPAADNNNNFAGAKHPVTKSNTTVNAQQGADTAAVLQNQNQHEQNVTQQTEQNVLPQQQTAPVLAGVNHSQHHQLRGGAGNGFRSSVGSQTSNQSVKSNPTNTDNNLVAGTTPSTAQNGNSQATQAIQSTGSNNNAVSNSPASTNPVNTNPVQSNVMAGDVNADHGQATNAAQANQPNVQQANNNKPDQQAKPKVKKVSANPFFARPQFAISVLGSPDINGVNSFSQSRVGTNIGMLFSVSFGKLSISTGAAYSKKPYETDAADYHAAYQFRVSPSNIYADCRVLDIPLNVDYRFYRKNRNSFSVGTGLSSYIMLSERYSYNYAIPGAGPAGYAITNRNQHILGVLNLNTTYQRQINSKFSVGVQPYLKVPLTNIGAGQVRLQSAGVAVGFSWNISPSKTP